VEEKVAKVSKVRLLRQFSYGVIAYVVATALVVLLPIFVSSAPGEEAVRVVLVMQNVVLWVFMAGLAWIFRRAPAVTRHLLGCHVELQMACCFTMQHSAAVPLHALLCTVRCAFSVCGVASHGQNIRLCQE